MSFNSTMSVVMPRKLVETLVGEQLLVSSISLPGLLLLFLIFYYFFLNIFLILAFCYVLFLELVYNAVRILLCMLTFCNKCTLLFLPFWVMVNITRWGFLCGFSPFLFLLEFILFLLLFCFLFVHRLILLLVSFFLSSILNSVVG